MYRKIKKPGKNNLRKALTLTELLITSAILTAAMVPLLKGLTSAHHSSAVIEQQSRSLILAQTKIEYITADSIYRFDKNFAENNTVIDETYLCSVASRAVNTNLKKITVSVGYDSDDNGNLSKGEIDSTIATYIARRW